MSKDNYSNNNLGKKIKQYRKAKGITQEQLAEKIDIDTKYLARIEKGYHNPTFNVIKKLSKALDFDISKIEETSIDDIKIDNKLYIKSLQILNSATTDTERKFYLEALQHTQKCIKEYKPKNT